MTVAPGASTLCPFRNTRGEIKGDICGTHTQRQVRSGLVVVSLIFGGNFASVTRHLPLESSVACPHAATRSGSRSAVLSDKHRAVAESIPLYTLYTVTFVVTGVVTVLVLIPLLIPDSAR